MGNNNGSKRSSISSERDEDEFIPIKNFQGETVGWRERTDSDKLQRKQAKLEAEKQSSDEESSDEDTKSKSRFKFSLMGASDDESNSDNESRKSDERSQSKAFDIFVNDGNKTETSSESEEEATPRRSMQMTAVSHRERVVDKFKPSILPSVQYRPMEASAKLYKALENNDADTIIQILSSHTWEQRREIADDFKSKHKKTLRSRFKAVLDDDFEHICMALVQEPTQRDAAYVRKIVENNKSVNDLVGVLAWQTQTDLADIKRIYELKYGSDMELDLSKCNKRYRRVVEILCSDDRPEDEDQGSFKHWAQVEDDASALTNALKNEDQFRVTLQDILNSRSWASLPDILDRFEAKNAGKDLYDYVKKLIGKKEAEVFKTLFFALDEPSAFYAEEIFACISGEEEPNDDKLIQIFVQRSEVDLMSISSVFKTMFGKKLSKMIKDKLDDPYSSILLAILGAY